MGQFFPGSGPLTHLALGVRCRYHEPPQLTSDARTTFALVMRKSCELRWLGAERQERVERSLPALLVALKSCLYLATKWAHSASGRFSAGRAPTSPVWCCCLC